MGRIAVDKKRSKNPVKREEMGKKLFALFMKKGIDVSTFEICEAAGKSKATVYKHFDSKKDMVEHILSSKLEEIKEFAPILLSSSPFNQRYQQAVQLVANALDGITPIFLKDLQQEYPELWQQIEDLKQFALLALEQFYEEGIQNGDCINTSPKYLVLNDELFLNALTNPSFIQNKTLSMEELFSAYFEVRFNGILRR